jgi:type II secretory pathway pseudopilin PulG
MLRRHGASLIELLICIAIVAVLLGIMLTAISKVRSAAVHTQSVNNLRQIILATHQLADEHEGRIKDMPKSEMPTKAIYTEQTIFQLLLNHILPRSMPPNPTPQQVSEYWTPRVPTYLSPGDPSLDAHPGLSNARNKCSYVCNLTAFDGVIHFPVSIPDGTHSTIAFAERYFLARYEDIRYDEIFAKTEDHSAGNRRPTFADAGWFDVMPVRDPDTGRTVASVRGLTFQVRPRVEDANPKIPHTPFANGLPVALFDGSVRTLSPRIEEHVFWSLVTPNGGEVVGDF